MGLILLGLAGCRAPDGPPPSRFDEPGPLDPVSESLDVVLGIWDEDRPRLRISAGRLAQYEIQDSVFQKLTPYPDTAGGRVEALLYGEDGAHQATLTAQELIYYEEEGRFFARGDVVVVTTDGRRLQTDRLHWTEADRSIHTDGFVRITSATEDIQGYQLRANEDLSEYEILNPRGPVQIDDPL